MKYLSFVVVLILFVSFGSAHYDYRDDMYKEKIVETRYSYYEPIVLTKTTTTYYDNDDRHSTYEYRHGYSYRASQEYYERKIDLDYRDRYDYRNYGRYDSRDYRDRYYDYGRTSYRYEYVPHLRTYERQECYVYPPADRLFYVKC